MREGELLVELRCQERQGRKLRPTPYVDGKKALCASFAFEDHKTLAESSMLRRVLKLYERKAAVPLLTDTKNDHLMALCVEFGVQQPHRLLDQRERPFAVRFFLNGTALPSHAHGPRFYSRRAVCFVLFCFVLFCVCARAAIAKLPPLPARVWLNYIE